MRKQWHLTVFTGGFITLMGLSLGANAATNTWLVNGTNWSGEWSTASRWSLTAAPGTAGHTDDDVVFGGSGSGGPFTLTLDNASLATLGLSDMTVRSISRGNTGAILTRTIYLQVAGTQANPFTLNVGPHAASAPAINLDIGGFMALEWTNLTVTGANNGIQLGRTFLGNPIDTFSAVNSNISLTQVNPNTGFLLGNQSNWTMAVATLTGGSLTVTNATSNAQISVGSASLNQTDINGGKTPAVLNLNDTLLSTNNIVVQQGGTLNLNNANLASTSDISGTVTVQTGGRLYYNGGKYSLGTLTTNLGSAIIGWSRLIDIDNNAQVTVGNINFNGTAADSSDPLKLRVGSGSLDAANINLGGNTATKGHYILELAGGTVTVANTLQLGHSTLTTRHGSGYLQMTGGTLNIQQLKVGASVSGTINAAGYYEQTAGTTTITGAVSLLTKDAAGIYGTGQFVVGSGATLNLTGNGFVKVGTTDWLPGLLDPSNLSFEGTLVFDPASAMSQNLLAFGVDVGNVEAGFANNFAVGTLDLSALDAVGEQLAVSAAGNQAIPALYISTLLGLDPLLDGNGKLAYLDSAFNLYYLAGNAPNLNGQTFDLTSGGQLIPVGVIPEPASLALLVLGGTTILWRRKRINS